MNTLIAELDIVSSLTVALTEEKKFISMSTEMFTNYDLSTEMFTNYDYCIVI